MSLHRWPFWMVWLNLAFVSSAGAQPATRQVLLLSSFQRDPIAVFAQTFRTELSRESPEPINFFEVSIRPTPFDLMPREELVVDYVRATATAVGRLDLVVSMAGTSAVFVQKYGEQLFPTTPLIQAAGDARFMKDASGTLNQTTVALELDLPRMIENLLVLLPETTRVFVVIGTSQSEEFWRKEMVREFERFKDRLTFVWFNELSFTEILERSSALPPHSAIFYPTLVVDGKGVFHSEAGALAQLRSVANAPIFGIYDFQLGHGIVGGPLTSMADLARSTAAVALRILRGETPRNIKTAPQRSRQPTYDWRELRRWGISEARLPVGSIVQFRQLSAWDQYKIYILAALATVALQSTLIARLVVQRTRRRRTELALRESEQRFRVMADTAPVLIWRAGIDKARDFFNKPWLDFRGRTQEQECGSGWADGVHPADLEECLRVYGSGFDARASFDMEYRLQRADGEYRWVLDTGVPRYDEGGHFAGYIGSAIDITERKQVEEQNHELAGRLINAQEAERARIARDLHDDLSQQLANLGIMLSGLKRSVGELGPQPEVERGLATLEERTVAAADRVRNLSHELHPSVLEHVGLVAVLRRHCDDIQRLHPVTVSFGADGEFDALSPDAALCLFRVSQEALANVVRHARASAIRVELLSRPEQFELSVIDNGIGFTSSEHTGDGLGLRSIHERMRLIRGQVRVESRPGDGTRLLVQVPRAAQELEHLRVS